MLNAKYIKRKKHIDASVFNAGVNCYHRLCLYIEHIFKVRCAGFFCFTSGFLSYCYNIDRDSTYSWIFNTSTSNLFIVFGCLHIFYK